MAEVEYVEFQSKRVWLIKYNGTNGGEVTAYLGTDQWVEDAEGRTARSGDWLYLDQDGNPAIVSNSRKLADTRTIEE